MTCHDAAAYVLGALSPTERRDFERHLAGCARCQAQVREFAGLPALLALAQEIDFAEQPVTPAPPADLLPRLLTAAATRRRRRLWWYAAGVAATLSALALGAVLLFRPAAATTSVADGPSAAMTPLTQGPIAVSLRLANRDWGTAITVTCNYPGGRFTGTPYTLAVIDRSGTVSTAGSWAAAAGVKTVQAATALHPDEIAAIEVRLPDGTPIMRTDR